MSADRPARRIVVHDHPIKVCAGHPRVFVPIGAGDRIVALWRDDDDVPHVRVYRVTGR